METILTIVAVSILTPLLTFLTMWVRANTDKEVRRDKRDDGYIQELSERVSTCEKRHNERDTEMKEIRAELKNRDEEYLRLYQEHTTIRAKYEVLLADHTALRTQYETTVMELIALKDTLKQDREITAELATKTAKTV